MVVHFLRDMLGHCNRQAELMIATAIRHIVNAEHSLLEVSSEHDRSNNTNPQEVPTLHGA